MEPKNKGGRPRKHPKPDPNAPKRPPGRPRKQLILSTGVSASTPTQVTDWSNLDDVGSYSNSAYKSAHLALEKQRLQFEVLSQSIYEAILDSTAKKLPIDKTLLDTYERYNQRLRQVTGDLTGLAKSRMDELKIQAHLAALSTSKVTAIYLNIMPPGDPVQPKYRAEDYIKISPEENPIGSDVDL